MHQFISETSGLRGLQGLEGLQRLQVTNNTEISRLAFCQLCVRTFDFLLYWRESLDFLGIKSDIDGLVDFP